MHHQPLYARAEPFPTGRGGTALHERDVERIYAEHAQPLYGFLAYRTGDADLAEDLLADTFERLLRARHRFDSRRGSEKAWVYAIALNCLRDDARRRSAEARAIRRLGATDAEERPAEHAVFARDGVGRALHVLTDQERETIALRFGAECTVPEIAELAGEPLTTVEARLYRALRKLRDEMSEGVTRS